MQEILFNIFIIFLLILANGIFAMAEIALVSAKKSRLQRMIEAGNLRAKVALELANEPNRFLSTVQFGITLIGIGAGAFGGAMIADKLSLLMIPFFGEYSASVSITLVVFCITLLSIILGELVPKKLGLMHPEQISVVLARPMQRLARYAGPIVHGLGLATDGALKILGVQQIKQAVVSEEELKFLIEEGMQHGVIDRAEKEMVEGVLDLDQLTVADLMTSRTRIVWLNIDDPDEVNWRKIVASGHSSFPVYQGNRDQVLGVVSVKGLWANLALANRAELKNLLAKPDLVPSSLSAMKLLEMFRKTGKHIMLATDEFGGIDGLVSVKDVLEAIVGELPSKDQPKKYHARKREDGSWLIDGMIDIDEFKQIFSIDKLPYEDRDEYQTLGGFMISQFERIPEEGDRFDFNNLSLEVLDMDRQRIDKVAVVQLEPPAPVDQRSDTPLS